MKTSIKILALAVIPLVTGCTHHWPKDSYIQGATSTINTPWGPSVQRINVLATGSAAAAAASNPNIKNLPVESITPPLAP
jgi:hypothetical protein